MLFRNFHGNLININKDDYINNSSYYLKIITTVLNKKIKIENNNISVVKNILNN